MCVFDYIFYSFYRFTIIVNRKKLSKSELNDRIFWTSVLYWSWIISLIVLPILSLSDILRRLIYHDNKLFLILLISSIILLQYFLYFHKDKWHGIVDRIDGFPKKKKKNMQIILTISHCLIFITSILCYINW
jgi:hypothetical protein